MESVSLGQDIANPKREESDLILGRFTRASKPIRSEGEYPAARYLDTLLGSKGSELGISSAHIIIKEPEPNAQCQPYRLRDAYQVRLTEMADSRFFNLFRDTFESITRRGARQGFFPIAASLRTLMMGFRYPELSEYVYPLSEQQPLRKLWRKISMAKEEAKAIDIWERSSVTHRYLIARHHFSEALLRSYAAAYGRQLTETAFGEELPKIMREILLSAFHEKERLIGVITTQAKVVESAKKVVDLEHQQQKCYYSCDHQRTDEGLDTKGTHLKKIPSSLRTKALNTLDFSGSVEDICGLMIKGYEMAITVDKTEAGFREGWKKAMNERYRNKIMTENAYKRARFCGFNSYDQIEWEIWDSDKQEWQRQESRIAVGSAFEIREKLHETAWKCFISEKKSKGNYYERNTRFSHLGILDEKNEQHLLILKSGDEHEQAALSKALALRKAIMLSGATDRFEELAKACLELVKIAESIKAERNWHAEKLTSVRSAVKLALDSPIIHYPASDARHLTLESAKEELKKLEQSPSGRLTKEENDRLTHLCQKLTDLAHDARRNQNRIERLKQDLEKEKKIVRDNASSEDHEYQFLLMRLTEIDEAVKKAEAEVLSGKSHTGEVSKWAESKFAEISNILRQINQERERHDWWEKRAKALEKTYQEVSHFVTAEEKKALDQHFVMLEKIFSEHPKRLGSREESGIKSHWQEIESVLKKINKELENYDRLLNEIDRQYELDQQQQVDIAEKIQMRIDDLQMNISARIQQLESDQQDQGSISGKEQNSNASEHTGAEETRLPDERCRISETQFGTILSDIKTNPWRYSHIHAERENYRDIYEDDAEETVGWLRARQYHSFKAEMLIMKWDQYLSGLRPAADKRLSHKQSQKGKNLLHQCKMLKIELQGEENREQWRRDFFEARSRYTSYRYGY